MILAIYGDGDHNAVAACLREAVPGIQEYSLLGPVRRAAMELFGFTRAEMYRGAEPRDLVTARLGDLEDFARARGPYYLADRVALAIREGAAAKCLVTDCRLSDVQRLERAFGSRVKPLACLAGIPAKDAVQSAL